MIENRAAQPATRCGAPKAATSEAELHSLARDLDMRIMVINCAALAGSSKRFSSRGEFAPRALRERRTSRAQPLARLTFPAMQQWKGACSKMRVAGRYVEVRQTGSWFVCCEICDKHLFLFNVGPQHEEAQAQLRARQWRNAMKGRLAACCFWSCPVCAKYWRGR